MEDESLSQCLHFIPYSTSLHKFQNYLGAQRERFEVTDSFRLLYLCGHGLLVSHYTIIDRVDDDREGEK